MAEEQKPLTADDIISDPRRAIIHMCLDGGMTLWKQWNFLFAGEKRNGILYTRDIGLFDDTAKKILELFDVPPESIQSGPHEPPDPRREKIASLRKEEWTLWKKQLYGSAWEILDGKPEEKKIQARQKKPSQVRGSNQMGLYAGKIVDGKPEKTYIGFFDDVAKEILWELGVPKEDVHDGCPDQFAPKKDATEKKDSTLLADWVTPGKKKIPTKPRKPLVKLDFNTIRSRVSEWNEKGYYFKENKGWVYACQWDKDARKMDEQSIGPYDDRIKKLLKRMKLSLRR